MAQHGIYCTYIGLGMDIGDDGSAPQVAIFDIFISYFGFGEISGQFGTLLKVKTVGSIFLGDPDGSTWHIFWLIMDLNILVNIL